METDNTILQQAITLKSALATAEKKDLNGHKVNKCIMKHIWKNTNIKKRNCKAWPAELSCTEMNLQYNQNWQLSNAIC
jgi:hypothetical protein